MKKRKLLAPFIAHSWVIFAAGAGVWLLTVLFFRIKSANTGNPYMFENYGSADLITPVIIMLMGIFSAIPFYGACTSCNVSRYRSTDAVGLTGAFFSIIYTILDIIAVKNLILPAEGFDTVNCFFEGEQRPSEFYSFDELFYCGQIIFPVIYSFIFFFSMWLCGAVIGRAFANGEKTTAIYETAAFIVFIPLFTMVEGSNTYSMTSSVIDSLRWLLMLIIGIIIFTDLPVLIFMITYIAVYPPVREAKDVVVNNMLAGMLNFVLLIIVWFILVRRVEVYLTKNHKNEDTGGDDDA